MRLKFRNGRFTDSLKRQKNLNDIILEKDYELEKMAQ